MFRGIESVKDTHDGAGMWRCASQVLTRQYRHAHSGKQPAFVRLIRQRTAVGSMSAAADEPNHKRTAPATGTRNAYHSYTYL
jgi:hypothetical protein